MSRVEFNNKDWRFVAGSDDVTGTFMQIWIQPADEQDCAIVSIDNQGVTSYFEDWIPPSRWLAIRNLIDETDKRYKASNIKYSNLDFVPICKFRQLLGFDKSIDRQIYEAIYDF
jgi:hypothetical protein